MFCVHLANHTNVSNSYSAGLDPTLSEVRAKLVPPKGVPKTKIIPSSCGANTPKSGNFCQ